MMRLVVGQFHPSLEEAFRERVISLKKKNPLAPLAVVAPSKLMERRLKEVTAGAGDFLNVDFFTLSPFASEICRFAGKPVPPADPMFHVQLIRSLMEKDRAAFRSLGGALHLHGTCRAIAATLRDLRDAAVDPNSAFEAFEEGFAGAEATTGEILELYRRYAQVLDDGKVSDDNLLYRTAGEDAASSALLQQFDAIFFYGFYDMTGVQFDLFSAIAKDRPTTMFFPCDVKDPAFAFAREFLDSPITGLADPKEVLPTEHIQRHPPEVRVVSAAGLRDEVWRIAKEILRLVHHHGYAFHEIGVVARNLPGSLETIGDLFGENAIPFVSSSRLPIWREPTAKGLRKLIDVIAGRFFRPDVIDFLAHPAFPLERFDGEQADLRQWDLLTRNIGIGRNPQHWLARLEPWTSADFPCRRSSANEGGETAIPAARTAVLFRIVRALADDVAALPETGSYGAFRTPFRSLMEKYLRDDGAVLPALLKAIDKTAPIDLLALSYRREEFFDILLDVIGSVGEEDSDGNIRGVKVLDPTSARGLPFKVLFLMGMNERVFPRFIIEDPFLSDAARSRLSAALGNKISRKLEGYAEERLLFRLLIASAGERLEVSYQRADERGRVQVPSLFLAELPTTSESLPRRFMEKIGELHADFRTIREEVVACRLAGVPVDDLLLSGGYDVGRLAAGAEMMRRIEGVGKSLTPYDGMIAPPREWFERLCERGISPSALESFALCPFQFFAGNVLRLEELDEPEDILEPQPADVGQMYHRILKLLYERLFSDGRAVPKGDVRAVLAEVSDGVFREHAKVGPIRFPLLWEVMCGEIVSRIALFVDRDMDRLRSTGMVPSLFEQSAAADLALGAPREGEPTTIRVAGRIDRVDVGEKAGEKLFAVIDYKSGKAPKSSPATLVKKGKSFQLPLYLAMGEELLRERGREAKPLAGMFCYLTSPDREAWEFTREELEESRETLLAALKRFLAMMSRGRFFFNDRGGMCDYCPVRRMCRKEHRPSSGRIRRSDEAKGYYEIIGEKPARPA